jgi:hypothetical protein
MSANRNIILFNKNPFSSPHQKVQSLYDSLLRFPLEHLWFMLFIIFYRGFPGCIHPSLMPVRFQRRRFVGDHGVGQRDKVNELG